MRDRTYPAVIGAAKTAFRVLGQRITVTGAEHVPTSGGVLLASNHVSYVDFVYAGLAANPSGRLVRFMAKQEIFAHRFGGPVMRSMHHIPVDRGEGIASYHAAVDYLRAGEAVGIFPEATISRAMELKDFKTGAVRIAAAAGVPLVPVIVWGTQRMITKDHPRDFSRGLHISLRVGPALHPDGSDPIGDTAELKAVMTGMLEETVLSTPVAERPPGAWWVPASMGGSAPTLEQAAEMDAAERRERAARRAARRAKS